MNQKQVGETTCLQHDAVVLRRVIASAIINLSIAEVDDIQTGIEDGTYSASENRDILAKKEAVERAEVVYRESVGDVLTLPRDMTSLLIDMARNRVNDIESGLADGTYEAGQNTDFSTKRAAVDEAELRYLPGAVGKEGPRAEMQNGTVHASGVPATAQPQLGGIAAKVLGVTTLETRNSDRLDFYEISVWAIKDALEAAYLAGLAEGKRVEISTASSDGGYTITIRVNAVVSTMELRATLQAAYDEGAAGFFNIEEVADDSNRRIVFSRDLGDDHEMLAGRITAGENVDVAACAQLADELEEVQTGADCLTAVIAALRDPSNAVVAGLSAAPKGDL